MRDESTQTLMDGGKVAKRCQMSNRLDELWISLGLPPMAEALAWLDPLHNRNYAALIRRLANELTTTEIDTEHHCLLLRRRPEFILIPGMLLAVKIYVPTGKQPRLYCDYVATVTSAGVTFRCSRLRPLTLKGLRRAIRDAKKKPIWTSTFHVTRPGELLKDLGLEGLADLALESSVKASAAIEDALAVVKASNARIADMEAAPGLLDIVELLVPLEKEMLPAGRLGTIVEFLDEGHLLVEFAGEDGVAKAIVPLAIDKIRPLQGKVR